MLLLRGAGAAVAGNVGASAPTATALGGGQGRDDAWDRRHQDPFLPISRCPSRSGPAGRAGPLGQAQMSSMSRSPDRRPVIQACASASLAPVRSRKIAAKEARTPGAIVAALPHTSTRASCCIRSNLVSTLEHGVLHEAARRPGLVRK